MIYKDYKGKKLSALGMGCMRLPCNENDNGEIDVAATKEMVAYAFEKGINYFDTAWGYHKGQSEPVMGEVLSEYPRESFYLASKFPGYDSNVWTKVEEIFEKQLQRCRVDYFDFYMFHCLCETNIDAYLDEKYGIFKYLSEQKRNGRIKHLGFSTHASLEDMKRFLDAYGKDMEFCQIQINWFDWEFQNAKAKVELVSSYGIPVWVMEPVRGGFLAKLDEAHEERLRALRPDASMPDWAFRFIQSIPEVAVTLSGMSNFEQIKENIATFETEKPLNDGEMEVLFDIAKEKMAKSTLPCTACRYCVDHCPQGLDIPKLIEVYNCHISAGSDTIEASATAELDEDKKPSSCIGCRSCEEVCPQNIRIADMMTDFVKKTK